MRGRTIRHALDVTSWEAATQIVRDMELGITHAAPMTVVDAARLFLEDIEARKLGRESVKKYRALTRDLEAYAKERGFRYLSQFDLQALRDFRVTWTGAAITTRKKLERLRSFLRFAHQTKWIDENPAIHIKPPKTTSPPTLPLEPEDVLKIIAACDEYPCEGKYLRETPSA